MEKRVVDEEGKLGFHLLFSELPLDFFIRTSEKCDLVYALLSGSSQAVRIRDTNW